MFDSHCHLDDDLYDPDRAQVLTRARAAGVEGVLVPGYAPDEWATLETFCAQDPLLCCAVGLHPWYIHTLTEQARTEALEALPDFAKKAGAVAIGECGLDGKKARDGSAPLALQHAVLAQHLEVARALKLPVILHCVNAHGALLEQLEAQGPLPQGGVMHSYSGPRDLVSRYARLGLYFSFAGSVTRPTARRPREALQSVPLERLLVESDGPDQLCFGLANTRDPSREAKRSEPAHILHVLSTASDLRPEPPEQIAHACRENARKLFAR